MKNRLILRADGDKVIGYGHVMRLLALASILRKKYDCIFIIQNPDEFIRERILAVCVKIITFPLQKNTQEEASFLISNYITSKDIVVLDGYHFDTNYQRSIKNKCFKLVCIDDLKKYQFVADAVINHAEGIFANDYSKEYYTRLFLGSQYAILRKNFLKLAKANTPNNFTDKHRIFISLGGTDQKNYTKKALKEVLKSRIDYSRIDIVIGQQYPFRNKLEKIISKASLSARLYTGLDENQMSSMMKKSDIGICSASTVSYEYSMAGGLLLVYKTADNQKDIYRFLIKTKVAFPVKELDKLHLFFANKKRMKEYYHTKQKYFSGDSEKKLLSIFDKLEIYRSVKVRKASKKDLSLYYKWANDPQVRKNSINSTPIQLEDHVKWFTSVLKNKSYFMYVIERGGKPVAQIRFDNRSGIYEIGYSIDQKSRGKGLGTMIVIKGIEALRKDVQNKLLLRAVVKPDNEASGKVFFNAGFKKSENIKIKDILYNTYLLEIGKK